MNNRLFKLRIIYITIMILFINQPVYAALANEYKDSPHHVYVFAVENDLPPFSYVDKQNQVTGFAIELAKNIAQREHLHIIFLPMNLYQAINELKHGDVDAILGLKYTADRETQFDFSNGYFTMSKSIVIPKTQTKVKIMSDLHNQTIAIENNSADIQTVENIRRAHMNMALNEKDALKILTMNRAAAFIGNRWTANYYLSQWGKENEYSILNTPIQPADYAVAVQDGHKSLLETFNKGLLNLKATGKYDDIYYKWFGNHNSKIMKQFKFLIISFFVLLLLFFIGLIIGIIWNKRLQTEVEKQTRDLSDANRDLEYKQREIEDSNIFKEQILNSSPSGIVTFDLNGQILTMNVKAKMFLGETTAMAHPLTLHVLQLIHEMKGYKDVKSGELELYHAGESYVIYYHFIYLVHADETPIGFLLTFADRTEEQRLQEKLSIQEKMHALGQLSAGVAHEMRNPLTSIKTFIELLPEKYDNPSFRNAIRHHVPTEINRLNKIIENLLDYSRPNRAQKSTWNVKELLESILILFKPTLKNEGIKWTVKIESQLTIFADSNQVKQVLINVILNAIDAMKEVEKKSLMIEGFEKNGQTYLNIKDTGVGMSTHLIERIFEPFYTSKTNGVGLGMTICYQLLQENHGNIKIDSCVNEGTVIDISLPTKERG